MYEDLNDYDSTLKAYNSIQKKINCLAVQIPKRKGFLGFDGYVDSLYSLVQSRENITEWNKMEKMETFGGYVLKVAGSSANIERVLKRKISGGFAPNTCRAINSVGMNVTLMAAIGYPDVHDSFKHLVEQDTVHPIPICNPGETLGLEFDNGKIMLTDFENIFSINWERLIEKIGIEGLCTELENADIIGMGHWSLVHGLTEIWKKMIESVFPSIDSRDTLFFVDLSDIKKRSKSDILEMLNTLKDIEEYFPVLLSLNDQEAIDITKALDGVPIINPNNQYHSDYYKAGININEKANLSYLVIHSPHFATITAKNQEHFWVTEGYTSKPRYTTGAGDHFHSGTVIGLSCGLNPAESILLGNALTAIFVRTGKSPSFKELERFIRDYLNYIESDNPEFRL